ncbi:MAG: sugar ABC transporter ATP-binding protein [Eubacteriales bacterium]|nr:sugar ABC transporter ATP-binding protein [Eubacteriales bacterium]
MDNGYLLEMKQIDKQFPGVHALDHVDFRVRPGEIHALMGENGAGKSTLMKVLTGLYRLDSGEIRLEGRAVSFGSPLESQRAGISTIYQEINLIPYLSVAENICLGREPMNRTGIDWRQVNQNAAAVLGEMGVTVDVTQPLCAYGTAIQQMVAIARAISVQAKLVVMDEPTSSLDEKEVAVLFQQMRKLKEKGLAMIFISHRLDEIFEICDTVTILKDGKRVSEDPVAGLTKLELVSRMIGRDAADVLRRKNGRYEGGGEQLLFEVRQAADGGKLRGVSLGIRRGEILGLAGLLGSGRTELAKVVFGDNPDYSGELLLDGGPVRWKAPRDAIAHKLAYCPEDRKAEGIFPYMSIRENMTMALLPRIARGGVVDNKRQKQIVQEYIGSLAIKTPGPEQLIRNLSGGNQQKVLLARWLCMEPRLIILDEPTRGIDIGAKSEIETLIQQIAGRGISVLLISSELEELVRNCHRVVVMRDGRNIGELEGDELSEARIMQTIAQDMVREEDAG